MNTKLETLKLIDWNTLVEPKIDIHIIVKKIHRRERRYARERKDPKRRECSISRQHTQTFLAWHARNLVEQTLPPVMSAEYLAALAYLKYCYLNDETNGGRNMNEKVITMKLGWTKITPMEIIRGVYPSLYMHIDTSHPRDLSAAKRKMKVRPSAQRKKRIKYINIL